MQKLIDYNKLKFGFIEKINTISKEYELNKELFWISPSCNILSDKEPMLYKKVFWISPNDESKKVVEPGLTAINKTYNIICYDNEEYIISKADYNILLKKLNVNICISDKKHYYIDYFILNKFKPKDITNSSNLITLLLYQIEFYNKEYYNNGVFIKKKIKDIEININSSDTDILDYIYTFDIENFDKDQYDFFIKINTRKFIKKLQYSSNKHIIIYILISNKNYKVKIINIAEIETNLKQYLTNNFSSGIVSINTHLNTHLKSYVINETRNIFNTGNTVNVEDIDKVIDEVIKEEQRKFEIFFNFNAEYIYPKLNEYKYFIQTNSTRIDENNLLTIESTEDEEDNKNFIKYDKKYISINNTLAKYIYNKNKIQKYKYYKFYNLTNVFKSVPNTYEIFFYRGVSRPTKTLSSIEELNEAKLFFEGKTNFISITRSLDIAKKFTKNTNDSVNYCNYLYKIKLKTGIPYIDFRILGSNSIFNEAEIVLFKENCSFSYRKIDTIIDSTCFQGKKQNKECIIYEVTVFLNKQVTQDFLNFKCFPQLKIINKSSESNSFDISTLQKIPTILNEVSLGSVSSINFSESKSLSVKKESKEKTPIEEEPKQKTPIEEEPKQKKPKQTERKGFFKNAKDAFNNFFKKKNPRNKYLVSREK